MELLCLVQRAVVTAAATGIGRVIAERLVANGAQVHICDLNASALAAYRSALPTIIANMVLFLASAAGSKISGQALSVDGHTETLRT